MTNRQKIVDADFVRGLSEGYSKAGYPVPKWLGFAALFVALGYQVSYYDAKSTVSKYVYLRKGGKKFKVRFSNHKPSWKKEKEKDCDFFVGITNFKTTNTEMAVKAALEFFKVEEKHENDLEIHFDS